MSNIFFIRHENDFEFMLPLIINDIDPFIVIYGELSSELIKKIKTNNLNYINMSHKFNMLNLLFRLLNKITKGLLKRKISIIYSHFLVAHANKEIRVNINKVPFINCSNVIFDHNSSDIATSLVGKIKEFRDNNSLKFKIVSVPHGVGTIVNTMTDYIYTKPVVLSGFDMYDKIVCNDGQHYDTFIRSGISSEKLAIVGSLRYTKQWVDRLLKQSKVAKSENGKINVLIVHTKFMGNINSKEVERCLSILNSFNNLNIRIKSHPRGGLKEATKLASSYQKIDVVTENIVGHVDWSDYVVIFGSSAVYDAFILNKSVLLPSFAMSNKLSKDILNGVICFDTPDDFYEAIYNIAHGSYLELNYDYKDSYREKKLSWKEILT
jgi:hypothetical protein